MFLRQLDGIVSESSACIFSHRTSTYSARHGENGATLSGIFLPGAQCPIFRRASYLVQDLELCRHAARVGGTKTGWIEFGWREIPL